MNQEDADREFIEAFKEFSKKIVHPDNLVPVIVDVGENIIGKDFMDDSESKRKITDKDVSAVAFVVANIVVQKFVKAICSMIEDGVLVTNADKAAELTDKLRTEDEDDEEDEDEDEDDDNSGGLGDWLKLG